MAHMISGGKNLILDEEGKYWLDLQSGILNTPLGHNSTVVSEALSRVRGQGLINSYDRPGKAAFELVDLMREYQPGYEWKLFNTGGEAIDKAIQIVSTVIGRMPRIAVLLGSFHGKLMSMAWASFGDKLPWGNPLDLIVIDPTDDPQMIPRFDALIYEPVQGHGGTVADQELLSQLCYARDAFMIADEMITGFLRCGARFMSADFADIIVTGKGISGGAPLSLVGYASHISLPQGGIPVGWRSTGVGNNLCATIGVHVLKELIAEEDTFIAQIKRIERFLKTLGFEASGALGFKVLKDFTKTRKYFEDNGVIASWHNPPLMRVGPSFVTQTIELIALERALLEAGEL